MPCDSGSRPPNLFGGGCLVCPVRPSARPDVQDCDAWDNLGDAPIPALPDEKFDAVDLDDEVSGDNGEAARVPRPLPEPDEPTAAQRAQHNLTHWPYKSWCEHCVRSRRPNSQHRHSPSASTRTLPVFVADYCFLRDARDEDLTTIFVGRVYPSRNLFATVVSEKGGGDELAVKLFADFLRDNGVKHLVYKSDQERSIKTFIDASLTMAGVAATEDDDAVLCAVPEYSAIGESASNGRAERAVQMIEDQARTLKSALETRIGARIGSTHPIMAWLIRHCAIILNRFSVNPDGHTPYQALHGKRASDRFVEFGERVYFYVPKKLRYKLDMRWQLGAFVGVSNNSNEYFCVASNGNVVKSRSVVRVIASRRWDAKIIEKTIGVPGDMTPNRDEVPLDDIEAQLDPHLNRDADEVDVDVAHAADERMKTLDRNVRITMKDLKDKYGFTPGCPRCADMERGHARTNKHHNAECRLRLYGEYERHDDPKWRAVKHLLEPKEPKPDVVEVPHEPVQEAFEPPERQPLIPENSYPNTEPNTLAPDSPVDDLDLDDAYDLFGPDADDDGMEEDAPNTEDQMVDAFVLAGTTHDCARDYVRAMLHHKQTHLPPRPKPTTFVEVFGGGAICHEANRSRRNLNLEGLHAMDLRTTKPNGDPWNFDLREDRRLAREMIDKEEPTWIIGSPPCTPFSLWNTGMNYPKAVAKGKSEEVKAAIDRGRRHLNFVTSLYNKQLAAGRHFLHEHPMTALSWKDVGIMSLARHPLVHVVVADQCQYGLRSPSPDGGSLPALKPTRFMTSSPQMAARLSRRCDRSHRHQQLVGGRCANAAFYPLGLIRQIFLGMRDTRDVADAIKRNCREVRDQVHALASSLGPQPSDDPTLATPLSSSVPYVNGKNCIIKYSDENFKPKYVDEYTGEVLDQKLIKAAIIDELDYFNGRVWQIEHVKDMYAQKDYVRTRSRWILCNKGDADDPDMRARLVSCEVNKDKGAKPPEFHASTPPLEAQRAMFSRFASEPYREIEGKRVPVQMSFVDIRKAYFNGIPKRLVYIDLPKELGLGRDYVGKLVRSCYGTRDAGAIWEDCYRSALEDMGFRSGASSPCVFFHPERNMTIVVHGDDFNALGTSADLDWYEKCLADNFEIKVRGRMGPGGDCTEIKILNRILTYSEKGLTYEADPRHIDLLSSSMGLTAANSLSTPGVKDPEPNYSAIINDEDPAPPMSPVVDGGAVAAVMSEHGVEDML